MSTNSMVAPLCILIVGMCDPFFARCSLLYLAAGKRNRGGAAVRTAEDNDFDCLHVRRGFYTFNK